MHWAEHNTEGETFMTLIAKQLHNPLKVRAFAVHNAVVAAIVVWAIEVHVLGIDLGTRFGPSGAVTTLWVGQIIGASLFVSLAGWVLLSLMERRLPHAAKIWTVTALGVVTASLALPLFATTSTASMVALIIMHLSIAAGYIPFMYRSCRSASQYSA